MKNLKYFIYFTIFSFTLSCTRAVNDNKTNLSIQLPAVTQSTSLLQSTNKVSAMMDTGIVDVVTDEETFSGIMATGYTTGANQYPINCYLVAVSGAEPNLQTNYCGKSDLFGITQKTYVFGPMLGLRQAGSSMELTVDPGDNRKVLVFGLHALDLNECKDIATGKPSKSSLTKPHFLGASDLMKFEPGKSITVPVNLSMPVAANQIDDCVFNFGQNQNLPLADYIGVENRSFPQNILMTPISAGSRCEPIDLVLKSGGQYGQPAILSDSKDAVIKTASNSTVLLGYDDFIACSNDSTKVATTNKFLINAGETIKRIWVRTDSSTTSTDYTVNLAGLNSISTTLNAYSLLSNPYKFDLNFPQGVQKGICYPARIEYRKASGLYANETTSFDFTVSSNSGAGTTGPAAFYDDANCSTPMMANFSRDYTMPANTNFKNIYFKVPLLMSGSTTATSFGINVIQKSTPTPNFNVMSSFTGVSINDAALVPFIAQIRSNFKNYFNPNVCIPINIQYLDQKGNSFKPTGGTVSLVSSGTNLGGTKIFANAAGDCNSGEITVSGAEIANMVTASGDLTKFSVLNQNYSYGERTFTLQFNGGLQKFFKFFVVP